MDNYTIQQLLLNAKDALNEVNKEVPRSPTHSFAWVEAYATMNRLLDVMYDHYDC